MQKLYNENGERLTKLGNITTRAADEARIKHVRFAHKGVIPDDIGDSELLDLYELYLMSETYQDWLRQGIIGFGTWLKDYPRASA